MRVYPERFRDRFGDSMRFTFANEVQEARRKGTMVFLWFWVCTLGHLFLFGLWERLRQGRTSGEWRTGMGVDVSQAFRRLRRSPGFTTAAVITLALGIGASTAIFSLVHGVVLNSLPYPDADRLVSLTHTAPGAALDELGLSHGTYVHYREHSTVFDEITVYTSRSFALLHEGDVQRVAGAMVSRGFFEIFLDGQPTLGRAIGDDDQVVGAQHVAMISHALWRQRFGSDQRVIGRTIQVDAVPVEIVGVLPPGFDVPSTDAHVWLAQQIDADNVILGMFGRNGVARLKTGVTPLQAQAELQRVIPTMAERFNPVAFDLIVESGRLTSIITPLKESIVGDVERMLWILLGMVAFVLAIACANVANLFLVCAEGRRQEIALRAALGASKLRILRHHLAESLVLAIAGGVLGVLLARVCVDFTVRWGPTAVPRLHEVGLHVPVLVFTLVISLGAGLFLGLIPVVRQGGDASSLEMRDGGRTATQSRARQRIRDVLVVAQVALALIMLIGAGLMVRTFGQLRSIELGFDPGSALVFEIGVPRTMYPDSAAVMQFQQDVIDRLTTIPGAQSVGAIVCLPLDGCDGLTPVYAEGVPFESGAVPPSVDVRGTTAGYFRAMGIPLIEGRTLEAADHQRSPPAAVVSRNLANRLWPGESALGKRIYPDVPENEPPYTVVGVVGDVISYGLTQAAPEIFYVSFLGPYSYLASPYSLTFVVRADVPPLSLADPIRAAIRNFAPNVPLAGIRPLQGIVDRAAAPTAFAMLLLVVAGGVALMLGVVGVYGVLSYVVSQRTSEIGIRIALGAGAGDVSRMILTQGMSVAGVGVLVGLVGAVGLSRLMSAVLFGVSPVDLRTYASVSTILGVVVLLASYLPARRAAGVSPTQALQ